MPDNDSDRTKNTAQFQAFVDNVDNVEQHRSKSGPLVVVAVLAVLVFAAAAGWLLFF